MTNTSLPARGVVFWPVDSGDSTTVVIDQDRDLVLQVDLRDMAKADAPGAVVAPVVDRLIQWLPKRDGRPYLAAFALTHADMDHCCGFADLLDQVTIGQLWATPRLWREYEDGDVVICEDARAFQQEAERRVEATRRAVARGEQPGSGDRILVVGYDTDHDKHAYSDLPAQYLTGPGHLIAEVDGEPTDGVFEAFLHAPFKDDCASARNDTSLAMQLTLRDPGGAVGRILLLGDLAYPTIRKIFDYSEAKGRGERLDWNVLLAPHHCSKYVMHLNGEVQQDILDAFERHAQDGAIIVASSGPVPARDEEGKNPPHAAAKRRYLGIVQDADHFVCTGEWPGAEDPRPIAFGLGPNGLELLDPVDVDDALSDATTTESLAKGAFPRGTGAGLLVALAAAIAAGAIGSRRARQDGTEPGLVRVQRGVVAARGRPGAPSQPIGFGRQ
ncbi:MAG TPA: hypothetical protein VGX23_28015 [Actinocrinis sp.]|nr:hypothetical protein [Actinocrinis sp.]